MCNVERSLLCTFCWTKARLLSDVFFFFNDTATTEIYTLSLHDALPILAERAENVGDVQREDDVGLSHDLLRSEEHTSELQSQSNLVCRLLLEKKKNNYSSSLIITTRPP